MRPRRELNEEGRPNPSSTECARTPTSGEGLHLRRESIARTCQEPGSRCIASPGTLGWLRCSDHWLSLGGACGVDPLACFHPLRIHACQARSLWPIGRSTGSRHLISVVNCRARSLPSSDEADMLPVPKTWRSTFPTKHSVGPCCSAKRGAEPERWSRSGEPVSSASLWSPLNDVVCSSHAAGPRKAPCRTKLACTFDREITGMVTVVWSQSVPAYWPCTVTCRWRVPCQIFSLLSRLSMQVREMILVDFCAMSCSERVLLSYMLAHGQHWAVQRWQTVLCLSSLAVVGARAQLCSRPKLEPRCRQAWAMAGLSPPNQRNLYSYACRDSGEQPGHSCGNESLDTVLSKKNAVWQLLNLE